MTTRLATLALRPLRRRGVSAALGGEEEGLSIPPFPPIVRRAGIGALEALQHDESHEVRRRARLLGEQIGALAGHGAGRPD